MPVMPFTQEEFEAAARDWNCNCGPGALAFAIQKPLAAAHYALREFDNRGYTSPTMMKDALEELRVAYTPVKIPDNERMFSRWMALVRIQFAGPWTHPGANPRWAYRYTHWVATWEEGWQDGGPSGHGVPWVFDINCGMATLQTWEEAVIEPIVKRIKRCDGKWYPTHIWRLTS